jgi:hypothetical protein
MYAKIYADKIDSHQRRQLENALQTVNGAQNFFFISGEIKDVKLPGGEYVNAVEAESFLVSQYPKEEFKICITGRPLIDNWFSHEYRMFSIINISDWERLYAPPSLRCYIVYQVAQALLSFASDLSEEMQLRFVHEPPQGCMNDFCGDKSNIKLGMVAGNLCLHCKGVLLRYGTPQDAIDAVEKILRFVRLEAIGLPVLIEPDRAFIVMRFTLNDENDNAYKYGIRPGLEAVGIKVERADSVVSPSHILDKIKKYIDKSRFVVAKIDEDNLNVYFELGLAMGAEKDVLLISERELVLKVPPVLRNWDCLTYQLGDYEDLRSKIITFFEANYGFRPV